MPRSSQRILQATWNWRDPAADGAGRPALGRAALIQATVMLAVAALLRFALGHAVAASVVAVLAGVVAGLGLALPGVYRHVHRFGQSLGRGVGALLAWLLLVPFFYLFVTPVAAWLRWRGHDPLHRRRRDPGLTYWIPRGPQRPDENIARQFLREDRGARAVARPVGSRPERGDAGGENRP
ncbi:hypothetical protein KDM41_04705 [bacterium]|nr:hypothetical protein [bacterium]